jgi:hypothetical protein
MDRHNPPLFDAGEDYTFEDFPGTGGARTFYLPSSSFRFTVPGHGGALRAAGVSNGRVVVGRLRYRRR